MTIIKKVSTLVLTCFLLTSCSSESDSADRQPVSEGLTLRMKTDPESPRRNHETKLVVQVLEKGQPVTGADVKVGFQHDSGKKMERVKAKLSPKGEYTVKKTFYQSGVYRLSVYARKQAFSATAAKDLIVE